MKTKKGQFFSYDAIVAGALFAIFLTILFIYWSSIRSFVFVQVDDMFRIGLKVSDSLLSPGSPPNWNITSEIKQVGLTDRYGSVKINPSKAQNATMLDYQTLKSYLGLGAYEIYVVINSSSNTLTIGQPPIDAKGKITLVRPVVYNDNPANLSITVWANFTA